MCSYPLPPLNTPKTMTDTGGIKVKPIRKLNDELLCCVEGVLDDDDDDHERYVEE